MILQRKRHVLLGLGLSVALGLVVALPATASAASTLMGEKLTGASASGNTFACLTPAYSVTGTATGPYPGTFTETGTWSLSTIVFSATFTTSSGTTTINGSKTGRLGSGGLFGGISCNQRLGEAHADLTGVPYTATIHTANGNFHDEGTSTVVVNIIGSTAELSETFASSLTQPVRLAPTNKDQCKNGGWQGFFKNQGECVSSFQRQNQT